MYDAVGDLLGAIEAEVDDASDTSTTEDATAEASNLVVVVDRVVATNSLVSGSTRDHLVHKEILLSWGEVVDKFVHCFPLVRQHLRNGETKWYIGQHCMYEKDGKRYHYWGTDTAYSHSSRHGSRRRRDMVRVGLQGEHLAEMVAFVSVTLPKENGSIAARKVRPCPVYLV